MEADFRSPPLSFLVTTCLLSVTLFYACAGRPATAGPPLPVYKDFPATSAKLTPIVETAIIQSSFGLQLDVRASRPGQLVTREQPLPLTVLHKLAAPGKPKLRGKQLRATLQLVVTIQATPGAANHSRVRLEPVYKVYLSRWGDRRQWIQWRSNHAMELDLLAAIEELLARTTP